MSESNGLFHLDGAKLRALRASLGLSTKDVARRAHYGRASVVTFLENRGGGEAVLKRMADALGVPPAELATGPPPPAIRSVTITDATGTSTYVHIDDVRDAVADRLGRAFAELGAGA